MDGQSMASWPLVGGAHSCFMLTLPTLSLSAWPCSWGLRACSLLVWLGAGQGMCIECLSCEGWDGVWSNCCDILFRQLLSAGVVPVDYLERRFCVSQDPRMTVESWPSLSPPRSECWGGRLAPLCLALCSTQIKPKGFARVEHVSYISASFFSWGPLMNGSCLFFWLDLAVSVQLWAHSTPPLSAPVTEVSCRYLFSNESFATGWGTALILPVHDVPYCAFPAFFMSVTFLCFLYF